MEEPLFIKCEPEWLPCEADTSNLEPMAQLRTDNLDKMKGEAEHVFADPVVQEESSEVIKEEQESEDVKELGFRYSGSCGTLSEELEPTITCTITENCESNSELVSGKNKRCEIFKTTQRKMCSFCGKTFTSSKTLNQHKVKHRGKTCAIRTKSSFIAHGGARSSSRQCMYTHAVTTVICTVCGSSFTTENALQEHKLTHSTTKFGTPGKHCETNQNSQNFICSFCNKTFAYRSKLRIHIMTHTKEKVHECTTCGKMFRHKWHLQGHMVIHTKEKPYICNTCGKAFSSKSHLNHHQLCHTDQKNILCSLCRKSFRTNSHLKAHMFTHTEDRQYSCSTCGRKFRYKSNLTAHQLTHTRDRALICSSCGKSFLQKFNLTRHMSTHTAIKT